MKQFVPRPIKEAVNGVRRRRAFAVALQRFSRLPIDVIVDDDQLLRTLIESWGNHGWSAGIGYLRAVIADAASARSAILECGSGLTTVLMAVLEARSVPLISLEHDGEWLMFVRRRLPNWHDGDVRVVYSPLRPFDNFAWYATESTFVDEVPFDLVVCDGPPGHVPGGRYGLLPRLHSRLAPKCSILLDDYVRADEKEIVKRWTREFNCAVSAVGADDEFVRLTFATED